jgi:hypothetical protein
VKAGERARRLELELEAAGNPARAEQERRYLKSSLQHYGAGVPAIRGVASRFAVDLTRADLLALVDALWRRPVHECRMAAVELLDLRLRA